MDRCLICNHITMGSSIHYCCPALPVSQLKLNTICHVCFKPLLRASERNENHCTECFFLSENRSKLKRSVSVAKKHDRDYIDKELIDAQKFLKENHNHLKKACDLSREMVTQNSNQLKNVLDSIMLSKINQLVSLKDQINKDMLGLREKISSQLHLISIPDDGTAENKIAKRLLDDHSLGDKALFSESINESLILKRIEESSVDISYSVEDFKIEPSIRYVSTQNEKFVTKVYKIYTRKIENISCDRFETWPDKVYNFIEYNGNIIFTGERSRVLLPSVTEIYSIIDFKTFIKIGHFPCNETCSLEIVDSKIYAIGGNSNIIYMHDQNNYNKSDSSWKKEAFFQDKLGTTHSVLMKNSIWIVGFNSECIYEYSYINCRISMTSNGHFCKNKNKLIFCSDETKFIITGDKMLVYNMGDYEYYSNENYLMCSKLRCLGKGKVVFDYLYFVALDEGMKESIWRICLKTFDLVRIN